MAPKRNRGGEDAEATGQERKKLKLSASRAIAVQSVPQPAASTSATTSTVLTLKGTRSHPELPAVLDVEKFVEARAFEINAMQISMKNASAVSTHRVWQTLPRHLRRRAASHDVRRVPLRLRDRARSEMDVAQKASRRSVPKAGKDKRLSLMESFLKRQRKAVWLETHIWHAKRMHMEILWGYRLAIRPTEKAYRASHRASQHDAIIHDASYYTVLEVRGPELVLKLMSDRICDPQKAGPGSSRYVSGSRTNETHVYKLDRYPYGLVGPATFIWHPLPLDQLTKNGENATAAGKGKEKSQIAAIPRADALRPRSMWIRFHPAIYRDMLDTVKQVTSYTLADYKTKSGSSEDLRVDIIDRRGHLNIFEIVGPKSSQVLKGTLRPVAADNRQVFLQFWNSLEALQSPSSVPRGMIIGTTVHDPRLNFPPKNAKLKANGSQGSPKIVFPSAQLASSDLWDDTRRNGIKTPRYSKQALDERRSKNDIPGTTLNPLRQDDRIPIILIQRSLESQNADASQGIHGWTLMIPAGWSMSFLSSLIYTGSRVGGQQERQTQAFEAATLHFPRDYPCTGAYDEWSSTQENLDEERWQRKPPAKRVNFEALGTMHPWRPDWHELLEIVKTPKADDDFAFVPTQREMETQEDTTRGRQETVQPWLLRGSELKKIISNVSSVFSHGVTLLSEVNRLRLKRQLEQLDNDITPANLLKGALANIKITMCAGGTLADFAMIYFLPDTVILQWKKALYIRNPSRISLENETSQETILANNVPDQKCIIGYITTGHYSLARGHAYGLGAVALTRLIEVVQQNFRLHPKWNMDSPKPTMIVGVRNTTGTQCRAAYLEVLAND